MNGGGTARYSENAEMTKQKILVARPIFPDVIDRLKQHFEVDWNNGDALGNDELLKRLADKDGALTAGDPVGAATFAAAPRLRVVSNMAVGFNNFDMAAFNAANVLGTNTPDVLNETTADFGWALMMATARRVSESEHWLRAGHWKKWGFDSFLGADVYGSTLGVIGMGRIGQALARRARGFNMQVIYYNRSRVAPEIEAELNAQYVSKEELLKRADHVVLVLPYSAASHHTIGAAELAQMKPTATLTNIARGGIVDDAALAEALRAKRIAAAGLDVFEGEPSVNPALLTVPNIVLTPHIASATETTRRAMANLAADNLIAGLGEGPRAGQPPNPINPDVIGKARS
jgi:glyoxylate/hydroxypyruvate/2-ketogluconate reductase